MFRFLRMNVDLFFGTPRWRILEILARRPSSPLELARELQTSVSYISQQLRLLEAADFVVKQKTRLVEKGQPRTVFSLTRELLHVTALVKGTPDKKIIPLNEFHKTILRIWLIERHELHYPLEKFYWMIESEIDEIQGIFISFASTKPLLRILTDSKKTEKKINEAANFFKTEFNCDVVESSFFDRHSAGQFSPIYDPNFMFNRFVEKRVKGGSE